jgi:hypothetical protein
VLILIAGLPKSGTTILTYRVAAALDDGSDDGVAIDFEPAGGPDRSLASTHRHVITKKLVGTQVDTLDPFAHYDRRIWISRDPRDFLVSQNLYRWHREAPPDDTDRASFDRVLARQRAKEAEPAAVPFLDLEPADYSTTFDAVADLADRELDDGWLIYRYEDMVAGRYEPLDRYLGVDVVAEAEVADGLQRVVRAKTSGDWRHWFTPDDVAHYRGGSLDRYLSAFGYDAADWRLAERQLIDPAHGSQYMERLFFDSVARSAIGP